MLVAGIAAVESRYFRIRAQRARDAREVPLPEAIDAIRRGLSPPIPVSQPACRTDPSTDRRRSGSCPE